MDFMFEEELFWWVTGNFDILGRTFICLYSIGLGSDLVLVWVDWGAMMDCKFRLRSFKFRFDSYFWDFVLFDSWFLFIFYFLWIFIWWYIVWELFKFKLYIVGMERFLTRIEEKLLFLLLLWLFFLNFFFL